MLGSLFNKVTGAFDFRISFGKTLVAFDFDEKLETKHWTNNYILSLVQRPLSAPALCG